MGTLIMANKIEEHNPINSNLLLVTNTICSARILRDWVMGIIQFFNSIFMEFFCVKNNSRIYYGKKIIFIKRYI